jgi:hypothetical protein
MNERLQAALGQMENMIRIQRDCLCEGTPNHNYMHGMLNGLLCAYSCLDGKSPKYASGKQTKRHRNVRHKSLILEKFKL